MSLVNTDYLVRLSTYAAFIGKTKERVRQLIKAGKLETIFIDGTQFIITTKINEK